MWRNWSEPCEFGAFLCSRPRELQMPYVTWAAGLIREPFCYLVIDQPPVELLDALSWLLTFSLASPKMSSQLGIVGESKSAVICLNGKQSCYDKHSSSKFFCFFFPPLLFSETFWLCQRHLSEPLTRTVCNFYSSYHCKYLFYFLTVQGLSALE